MDDMTAITNPDQDYEKKLHINGYTQANRSGRSDVMKCLPIVFDAGPTLQLHRAVFAG